MLKLSDAALFPFIVYPVQPEVADEVFSTCLYDIPTYVQTLLALSSRRIVCIHVSSFSSKLFTIHVAELGRGAGQKGPHETT
jgi:hypothetical protein